MQKVCFASVLVVGRGGEGDGDLRSAELGFEEGGIGEEASVWLLRGQRRPVRRILQTHPLKMPKETQRGRGPRGIGFPGEVGEIGSHVVRPLSGFQTACGRTTEGRPHQHSVANLGGSGRTVLQSSHARQDSRIENSSVKVQADDVEVDDKGSLGGLDEEGGGREDVGSAADWC